MSKPRIPTLREICASRITQQIRSLKDLQSVPFSLLKPYLEPLGADQLNGLENDYRHLWDETHGLWEKLCKKDFGPYACQEPAAGDTWYLKYWRIHDARSKSRTARCSSSAVNSARFKSMIVPGRSFATLHDARSKSRMARSSSSTVLSLTRSKSTIVPRRSFANHVRSKTTKTPDSSPVLHESKKVGSPGNPSVRCRKLVLIDMFAERIRKTPEIVDDVRSKSRMVPRGSYANHVRSKTMKTPDYSPVSHESKKVGSPGKPSVHCRKLVLIDMFAERIRKTPQIVDDVRSKPRMVPRGSFAMLHDVQSKSRTAPGSSAMLHEAQSKSRSSSASKTVGRPAALRSAAESCSWMFAENSKDTANRG